MNMNINQLASNSDLEFKYIRDLGNLFLIKKGTNDTKFVCVREISSPWVIKDKNLILNLHKLLLEISKTLGSSLVHIPTICNGVLPYGKSDDVIPVECSDSTPLSEMHVDVFFDSVQTQLFPAKATTQFANIRMFLTTISKKIIISAFKTFKICQQWNITPTMKMKHMFINKDDEVIFTQYQSTPKMDVSELVKFLDQLKFCGGTLSESLSLEFDDLIQWVEDSFLDCTIEEVDEVLARVIFWTSRMRVVFITVLADAIMEGRTETIGTRVEQLSGDAFLCNNGSVTSICWYSTLMKWKHTLILPIFQSQDEFYATKASKSTFRKELSYLNFSCPWTYFGSLVVRMRDSFEHSWKIVDKLIEYTYPRDDDHLLGSYQYVFPRHILELAKSVSLVPTFAPKAMVSALLSCPVGTGSVSDSE